MYVIFSHTCFEIASVTFQFELFIYQIDMKKIEMVDFFILKKHTNCYLVCYSKIMEMNVEE